MGLSPIELVSSQWWVLLDAKQNSSHRGNRHMCNSSNHCSVTLGATVEYRERFQFQVAQ